MLSSGSKEENIKVISERLEIDNLLSRFKSSRSIGELEVLGKSYEGFISNISDVTLSINFKGIIPPAATFIEINVPSGHIIYSFRSSILDIQESEIIISTPLEIRTLIKRKYKRVNVDSIEEASVEFTIASGSTQLQDASKVAPKFSQIYDELSKQVPNIKLIIQYILIQLKTYSDDCNIVLHKKDDSYTTAVDIIRALKETLYIKNTRERTAYLSSTMPRIVSLGTYLKYLKDNGSSDEEIKNIMLKTITEDQKRGVRSYVYSPITVFGDVIGHIYMANVKTEFNDRTIYDMMGLGEIISEAFVKTKLFQLESVGAIKGTIINLSAGGALIEINDQYVMKFIHQNTKLKVSLYLKDVTGKTHVFNCSAKVLRVITNEGKNRIAMKFLELRWNEHDIIDKFVRKKIEFQQALS